MIAVKVSAANDIESCFKIRIQVFVNEQKVPLIDEIDHKDSISTHFLAYINKEPIGTARLVPDKDRVCHLGRLAVLKSARKQGAAKLLVHSVHVEAKKQGFTKSIIHAQLYLKTFYSSMGYVEDSGEVFIEDGLEHLSMSASL